MKGLPAERESFHMFLTPDLEKGSWLKRREAALSLWPGRAWVGTVPSAVQWNVVVSAQASQSEGLVPQSWLCYFRGCKVDHVA